MKALGCYVRDIRAMFLMEAGSIGLLGGVLGLIFSSSEIGPVLQMVGILLFSLIVVFQLVTLPVEFNASGRALKTLETHMILYGDELTKARKVLTAAAMTYVAALLNGLLQLIRLISVSKRSNR